MIIREPSLPPGWYPRSAGEITRFLEEWEFPASSPAAPASPAAPGVAASAGYPAAETGFSRKKSGGLAAISPHAGWYYSGAIAAAAFASLDGGAETLAILGGHLPARSPVLAYTEDAVACPLGPMEIDGELRDSLCSALSGEGAWAPDRYRDNTVEVLIPMARFFFPRARLLALRLPADPSSYKTGRLLAEKAKALGRRLAVIGSTDLTHYGRNYGFSPRGQGAGALAWVRNVNDRRFIDAVLSGDPRLVLSRAEEESSACSAGAVLAVLGFVQASKGASGPALPELLAYGTSADSAGAGADDAGGVPDSFVGYGAIGWG